MSFRRWQSDGTATGNSTADVSILSPGTAEVQFSLSEIESLNPSTLAVYYNDPSSSMPGPTRAEQRICKRQ